jgi:hypothetical protein
VNKVSLGIDHTVVIGTSIQYVNTDSFSFCRTIKCKFERKTTSKKTIENVNQVFISLTNREVLLNSLFNQNIKLNVIKFRN